MSKETKTEAAETENKSEQKPVANNSVNNDVLSLTEFLSMRAFGYPKAFKHWLQNKKFSHKGVTDMQKLNERRSRAEWDKLLDEWKKN